MRNSFRLLVIGALIAATIGVAPAGADKPDPPPDPTVTIGTVSVSCSSDLSDLTVAVAEITPDVGELHDFGINVARIGSVTIPYVRHQQMESWGNGWWSGSNDDAPPIPYTLNTADDWGGSWTNHSEMRALRLSSDPSEELFIPLEPTPFWEVGVWAGAVNSSGKGNRGNRAWGWEHVSFTVDCSGGTAVLTPGPEFTWCFEDEWTHENYPDETLVTWEEGGNTPETCPWLAG